jgi:ATP-dependent helicase HepA
MAEPNPFLNHAAALARAQDPEWSEQAASALDEAASTPWGQAILRHNPQFNQIYTRLAEGNIALEERVQLITDLEALHSFAGIINRTRRRDIGDFTIRKPETVVVEFTPAQKHLHDELLQVQTEIFSRIRRCQRQVHDDHNQTASSKLSVRTCTLPQRYPQSAS